MHVDAKGTAQLKMQLARSLWDCLTDLLPYLQEEGQAAILARGLFRPA